MHALTAGFKPTYESPSSDLPATTPPARQWLGLALSADLARHVDELFGGENPPLELCKDGQDISFVQRRDGRQHVHAGSALALIKDLREHAPRAAIELAATLLTCTLCYSLDRADLQNALEKLLAKRDAPWAASPPPRQASHAVKVLLADPLLGARAKVALAHHQGGTQDLRAQLAGLEACVDRDAGAPVELDVALEFFRAVSRDATQAERALALLRRLRTSLAGPLLESCTRQGVGQMRLYEQRWPKVSRAIAKLLPGNDPATKAAWAECEGALKKLFVSLQGHNARPVFTFARDLRAHHHPGQLNEVLKDLDFVAARLPALAAKLRTALGLVENSSMGALALPVREVRPAVMGKTVPAQPEVPDLPVKKAPTELVSKNAPTPDPAEAAAEVAPSAAQPITPGVEFLTSVGVPEKDAVALCKKADVRNAIEQLFGADMGPLTLLHKPRMDVVGSGNAGVLPAPATVLGLAKTLRQYTKAFSLQLLAGALGSGLWPEAHNEMALGMKRLAARSRPGAWSSAGDGAAVGRAAAELARTDTRLAVELLDAVMTSAVFGTGGTLALEQIRSNFLQQAPQPEPGLPASPLQTQTQPPPRTRQPGNKTETAAGAGAAAASGRSPATAHAQDMLVAFGLAQDPAASLAKDKNVQVAIKALFDAEKGVLHINAADPVMFSRAKPGAKPPSIQRVEDLVKAIGAVDRNLGIHLLLGAIASALWPEHNQRLLKLCNEQMQAASRDRLPGLPAELFYRASYLVVHNAPAGATPKQLMLAKRQAGQIAMLAATSLSHPPAKAKRLSELPAPLLDPLIGGAEPLFTVTSDQGGDRYQAAADMSPHLLRVDSVIASVRHAGHAGMAARLYAAILEQPGLAAYDVIWLGEQCMSCLSADAGETLDASMVANISKQVTARMQIASQRGLTG